MQHGDIENYGDDMIVASDDGQTWVGSPDGYLVLMWALPVLRPLSYLLSVAPLRPLVGRAFQLVTGNRQAIGGLLRGDHGCEHCAPRTGQRLSGFGQSGTWASVRRFDPSGSNAED